MEWAGWSYWVPPALASLFELIAKGVAEQGSEMRRCATQRKNKDKHKSWCLVICCHLLLAWTWTAYLSQARTYIHVSLTHTAHSQLLLLLQDPTAWNRLHPLPHHRSHSLHQTRSMCHTKRSPDSVLDCALGPSTDACAPGGILKSWLQVKNEEKADAKISSCLQQLPKNKDVPHHDIASASPLP